MSQIRLEADESYMDERLDKFLSAVLPDQSRSYLQKIIKDGSVLVNGKAQKASYRMEDQDEVLVDLPELKEPEIEAENIPLDILYEDDDLLMVNKPKGMVVHPSAGHLTGTLVNAVMYHCKDCLSGINGVMRPGIVHRIDMDTTGVLVICKNDKAHNHVAAQLKEHSITRKYRDCSWGDQGRGRNRGCIYWKASGGTEEDGSRGEKRQASRNPLSGTAAVPESYIY